MEASVDLPKDYLFIENIRQLDQETYNLWDSNSYLLQEKYWEIFFSSSFATQQLFEYFHSKKDEEAFNYVKFGINCFIIFVQANFTGIEISKTVEEFLSKKIFLNYDFKTPLAVNGEDLNTNTAHPVLLYVSKIIFRSCIINKIVNNWWYWRTILVQQLILDDLSPGLLSEADIIYKELSILPLTGSLKASLELEIAQLYLQYRHVSKSREHIQNATNLLGIKYKLIGKLGKRTKHQEKELAQLSLEVNLKEDDSNRVEVDDTNVPKNIPLEDDVRLNTIKFNDSENKPKVLTNTEQKLFLISIQEKIISRPQDELEAEEIQPLIDLILNQKNTYCVRIVTALIRCKLESKTRRTVERSLLQCDEIVTSFKRDNPPNLYRVLDVFSTGMQPVWKVCAQYADQLLNLGLVKDSLEIYLKIKLWEEVIVCYTILKLRHKAANVIQEQLAANPSVKLMCLLGDATDDVNCYEKAWEMSKRKSHRAQRHWANFLYNRKNYEEAVPHFEKSLSINPLQPNLWFRLGFAAIQTNQWQKAATAYRRYTSLEPDGFEAWNNLAQAYINLDNKRSAHQALLEALKCNYENWKVWENFLVVSCDVANYSDVIRAYHRLLDLKEKYLNLRVLHILIHDVYTKDENKDRFLKPVRELFGRLTAIYPTEPRLWELYSTLTDDTVIEIHRLQKAYRGFCSQSSWSKDLEKCKNVLDVCQRLGELVNCGVMSCEIEQTDIIIDSVKLNLSSAIAVAKKNDWEETREIAKELEILLKDIVTIIENRFKESE